MKKLFTFLIATTIVYSCSDVNPSKNPDAAIQFEDPVVAGICLKYFDSNSDGRISFAEAAAVQGEDLSVFQGTNIKKFDEFKYFKGVTYLRYWQWDRTPMTNISFPEGIGLDKLFNPYCSASSTLKRITFTCKSVPHAHAGYLGYDLLYSMSPVVIYVPKSSLSDYQKVLANSGFMNDRVKGY